jgi:anti-sigma-K factor RskA
LLNSADGSVSVIFHETLSRSSPLPGTTFTVALEQVGGSPTNWRARAPVRVPFGAVLAYAASSVVNGANATQPTRAAVADSAFDWATGLRRTAPEVVSLAMTVATSWV